MASDEDLLGVGDLALSSNRQGGVVEDRAVEADEGPVGVDGLAAVDDLAAEVDLGLIDGHHGCVGGLHNKSEDKGGVGAFGGGGYAVAGGDHEIGGDEDGAAEHWSRLGGIGFVGTEWAAGALEILLGEGALGQRKGAVGVIDEACYGDGCGGCIAYCAPSRV